MARHYYREKKKKQLMAEKKAAEQNKSRKKSSGKGKKSTKKKRNRNIAGKIITLIQLLASVVFLAIVAISGLAPVKYMLAIGVILLVLFGITFGLQFTKGKVKYVGIVLSLIITIILILGSIYFHKGTKVMEEVGGATYKTDNMVVVVLDEDPAESLDDAKEYTFGYQTMVDTDNTDKMIEDVESNLGTSITLEESDSVMEMAAALLDGDVDAIIYNEAYTSMIEENNEGYTDKIRVLYEYGIQTEVVQEERSVTEPFNVYVSGIDTEGDISTTSRSDVNIIMTVNPNTRKILLTTTPRDYYVTLPGISGESRDKLTHAGIYGVDASIATLENLYGIDITYYARVNFTSVINIVDALGGVDVNSDYDFTASNGGQHISQGVNHMDGATALAFARERYSFSDGDNQRGKNQERLIEAIINKALSPAILTGANQILSSVGGYVETNMTSDEMTEFINMQLNDGGSWEIVSQAATGTGGNEACFSSGSQELYVMWPDEAVVADLSQKMQDVLAEEL